MLDSWMDDLIKEMELPKNLPTTERGGRVLTFDNINIEVNDIPGGCAFYSSLASLPKEKTADFLTAAMHANLFGQETDGSILGLSDDYQSVILNMESNNIQNYMEFRNKLEDFVNTADYWTDEAKPKK